MAMLDRSAWYELARTTNWTPQFVDAGELFPSVQSDPFGIPMSEWETYDEPFKVSYREYVQLQREKDSGAYSVKAALARSRYHETADPGYINILKWHYGSNALGEYAACFPAARMARFSKAPSMRNMSVFFYLDELRHTQIELFHAHELVKLDRQFDWAVKAHHTMNMAALPGRHAADDIMMTRDVITSSIMVNLAFETGITNVQMVAMSADAANMGDFCFSNLITSIQSDEARHAQIGTPLVGILIRNGRRAEAQRAIDIGLWRMWKSYSLFSGIPMDYLIPLEKRDRSFKEYIEEFVVEQFERQIVDLGLERPWYWADFLKDIESHHHNQHMALWSWRKGLYWNPDAGVAPAERAWLEEKYPGWNATYGRYWDVITANAQAGRFADTDAKGMPCLCNMCQHSITARGGTLWDARVHQTEYEGRRFNFCGPVCQWIFNLEPDRYAETETLVDRHYNGEIDPADPDALLRYMGIGVISEGGRDAGAFSWARAYNPLAEAAE